ncbi:xanthine dehydrogenase family protein subunit M, partial [Streptomyces hygroscopicus]
AEERLRGGRPDEEALREAARAELADARPLPDNAFKVDLAIDLIVAGVRDLVARKDRA